MSSAAELLRWYIEAGADEALHDEPANHLQAVMPVAAAVPYEAREVLPFAAPLSPAYAPTTAAPNPSLAAALAEARALADAATSLEALYTAIRGFNGCAIKKTARNTVTHDGNPSARVMLIGEAPGESEDIQGIPFCGVSGQLLDRMLKTIGLDRSNSYITNTLFWRPPGNRQPSDEELELCRPFVEKHIALINPALLILVGGTATKAVLRQHTGITRLRGKIYQYKNQYLDKELPATVLFHPSYLLRQPLQKALAWQDLLFAQDFIVTKASYDK